MTTTTTLSYTSKGQGFPVLFLHGFCESRDIWQEFVSSLGPTYQIIAPDLPGFGESKDNKNYASIEDLAEEVYKLLHDLQVKQCVIVAHSLGGYVALALAEKYPVLVAGLCLFHSTAFPDTEEKKHTRNKTADFIDKKGVEAFIENFVPPLFYKGRRQELHQFIEKLRAIAVKTPKETAIAVTKAMRDRPDRTHVLKDANYPICFISGKEDEAVTFETAKDQFFLPKHSLVQALDETAHMGMFERPQETLLMVQYFISYSLKYKNT